MKLFLAGMETWAHLFFKERPKYALFSFAYITNDECIKYINSAYCKDYILDSGVFTFLNSKKNNKNIDFIEYAKGYIDYINTHNIKNYVELDLYNIIGIQKTEELREMLIRETGIKPIPVFHRRTGLDYFHKLINNYDYIAIGGLVTQDIKRSEYGVFEYFLKEAEKVDCKIHGLGLTNQKAINKYPFYSVDSTSWIGQKYGMLNIFDGRRIRPISQEGKRLKCAASTAQENLRQWVKYQKYVDLNL